MRRALLFGLVLAACGGGGGVKDEELGGLVVAPPDEPSAVDPGSAGKDPAALEHAFDLRHHLVAKTLGSHHVEVTSKYEVKEGDQVVDGMSDQTVVDVAADGSYHATYQNSADYGREVIWQGGKLYLRPRYARWHRRDPNDKKEPDEILDQIVAVAGDHYDLVGFAAEPTDEGAAKAGGRDGRKVSIRLAPSPRQAPPQALTQKKWRETITVQALDGDAVLDADTGLPLHAHVSSSFTFQRDGRTFTMTIEVTQEIATVPDAQVAIAPPPSDETVDTPERQKEVDERDALLQGMAPPAKRSGGAGVDLGGDAGVAAGGGASGSGGAP